MLFKFFILFTLSIVQFFPSYTFQIYSQKNFLIIENILVLFYHSFHILLEKIILYNLINF